MRKDDWFCSYEIDNKTIVLWMPLDRDYITNAAVGWEQPGSCGGSKCPQCEPRYNTFYYCKLRQKIVNRKHLCWYARYDKNIKTAMMLDEL